MKQHDIQKALRINRERAFRQLYTQAFPQVARQIVRLGGSQEDARDIFQDSLIVLYEKAIKQELSGIENTQAYLLGISRQLWLKKYRQQQQLPTAPLKESIIPDDFYEQPKEEKRLIRYLEAAGKKCMELLTAFYYHDQPLSAISRRFGFRNVRSATVQKFKCLEKVRAEVKLKQEEYETAY